MDVKTRCSHYVCGNNSFNQIDKLMFSKQHTSIDGDTLQLFYVQLVKIPFLVEATERLYFTLSAIWRINGERQLSCYGYDKDPAQDCSIKASSISFLKNTTMIQHNDVNDVTFMYANNLAPESKRLQEDGIQLQSSTQEKAYALKDGNLLEGQVKVSDNAPTMFFNNPSCMNNVKTVTCGFEHTLVLTRSSELYAFGSSSRGQCGHGEVTVDGVMSPRQVDTLQGLQVTHVAAGGWHSTATTDAGDLYVWGWNESGQLGLPVSNHSCARIEPGNASNNAIYTTSSLKGTSVSTSLSCEFSDIISTCNSKDSLTGGSRQNDDSLKQRDIPLEIHQDTGSVHVQSVPFGLDLPDDAIVTSVSCGSRHTCVLLDSGFLMVTGWNKYGQLGLGDTRDRDCLVALETLWQKGERVSHVYAEAWNTHIVTCAT